MAEKSLKNQLARYLIKSYINKNKLKTKIMLHDFFNTKSEEIDKIFKRFNIDKTLWFEEISTKPNAEKTLKDLLEKFKPKVETETDKTENGFVTSVVMPGFPKEIIKVKAVDSQLLIAAKTEKKSFEYSFTFNPTKEYLKSVTLTNGILYVEFEYRQKEAKVTEFTVK